MSKVPWTSAPLLAGGGPFFFISTIEMKTTIRQACLSTKPQTRQDLSSFGVVWLLVRERAALILVGLSAGLAGALAAGRSPSHSRC